MQKILEDSFMPILFFDNHWSFIANSKIKQFPNCNFYYFQDDENEITKTFKKHKLIESFFPELKYINSTIVSKNCIVPMNHNVLKINVDHKIVKLLGA